MSRVEGSEASVRSSSRARQRASGRRNFWRGYRGKRGASPSGRPSSKEPRGSLSKDGDETGPLGAGKPLVGEVLKAER